MLGTPAVDRISLRSSRVAPLNVSISVAEASLDGLGASGRHIPCETIRVAEGSARPDDEIIESAGKPGRHQIEPVRRARDEPFLKAVGHELWCPAQQPMSHGGGGEVTELPQRHIVL